MKLVTTTLVTMAIAMTARAATPATSDSPFASRYLPRDAVSTLISGATVLTGTGERLDDSDVLMRDGRIAAVGRDLDPAGSVVVDARGSWVTPGIIDVHSHLGAYPSPGVTGTGDGNESVSPNTAEVWVEHSVWPQDPGFATALAGGVTTLQILPGSSNLFGGRGVTLKNLPGRSVMDMKFPGAPHSLKMACGENPKRLYRKRNRSPATRMGNVAQFRNAWIDAADYRDRRREALADGERPPKRSLRLETLEGVLDGEILVHNHCYRADEMAVMIEVAREFGYSIAAFHHAVEAYKVADLLREHGICSAVWADWWGGKMEAFDGIRENAAILHATGSCVVIHSDSKWGIQRLNQEAAKVIGAAAAAGIDIPAEQAIRWLTANAAQALGIADETGSLEPGHMADVVLWDGDPFSIYTHVRQVWVDGALAYDRDDPAIRPVSDFLLGTQVARGEVQ